MNPSRLSITYLGGPTCLLEFGGVRLLTDPTFDPAGNEYTTGPVTLKKLAGPAVELEALGDFDFVLLSHDHHADNLDHAGRDLLASADRVLTTRDGAERLGGAAIGLAAWDRVELSGELAVTATPCRHGPAEAERGPCIGFVLEAAGGAVYVSGDTVLYDGVEAVAQRFDVGVAILNAGAATVAAASTKPLTFTAAEAVEVARLMPEATVVPLHFEGWEHFSEGRGDIQRAFRDAGLEDRLRWPVPGSAIAL